MTSTPQRPEQKNAGVGQMETPAISPEMRSRLQQMPIVQVSSTDPDALTVATVTGWPKSAAWRAVHDGRLPAIKISRGRYVVSTEVLLRIIDESGIPARPAIARGECEVCGTPLIGRPSHTKYCSTRCSSRAQRLRVAQFHAEYWAKLAEQRALVHDDDDNAA